MKNIVFQKLYLLSKVEKKARVIEFQNNCINMLIGPNDTGKSHVLRMLYWTLGCEPTIIHPDWQNLYVKTLLQFSINENVFFAHRDGKNITILNSDKDILFQGNKISSSDTSLSAFFNNLLKYNLKLINKKSLNEQCTDVQNIFFPFYIDQDGGWTCNNALKQKKKNIKSYVKNGDTNPLEYITGIKDDEYYQQLNEKKLLLNIIEKKEQEKELILNVRNQISQNEDIVSDINPASFQKELQELETQFKKYVQFQENYKNSLHELSSKKFFLETQKSYLEEYKTEIDKDFNFAQKNDFIICPICGTKHQNSFDNKYTLIEDIHECEAGIEKYNSEINKINEEITQYQKKLDINNETVKKLNHILSIKKEQHSLSDLINYETHKKMCSNFNKKLDEIQKYIEHKTEMKEKIQKNLRQINKKAQDIIKDFQALLKINKNKLEANTWNIDKTNKVCINSIKDSGSNVSRAIIAYRFALLETIVKHGSILLAPFVIDTPAGQQDQDDAYAEQIMKFIFENRPNDTQIIIASRDMKGYSPYVYFNKIEFKEKYGLLQRDSFIPINNIFIQIDEKIKEYIASKS